MVVSVEQMQALAATAKQLEPAKPSTNGNGATFNNRLDIPKWLTARGQGFKRKDTPDHHGRTVYALDTCPFDSGHGNDAAIFQSPDGKLGASCFHNGCNGRGWKEFRDFIGKPDNDHWDPPLTDHRTNGTTRTNCVNNEPDDNAKPKEPLPFTKLLTGGELLALDLRPSFLVKGVLVEGQPMIVGGRSKTLKTSIVCDLVVSLGSGTPFLGRFDAHRTPVGFWSGESGAATIRDKARVCAEARGLSLADTLTNWNFDLPKLSNLEHLDALEETIVSHGLKVAILDPLYLSLLSPETAGGASNLFMMGSLLHGITKLGQKTNCTIILLHHFRKGGQADDENPAGFEELAQSGVAEWARQWILLQRRCPFQNDGQHALWMRCGGSAGHYSLWGVNIDEGIIDPDTGDGRQWKVTTSPATEARQEAKRDKDNRKAAEQEKREGEQRDRLLAVLRTLPEGETERALSRAAGLNPAGFGKAIACLIQEGRSTTCQIVKNGATYDGFKATGK